VINNCHWYFQSTLNDVVIDVIKIVKVDSGGFLNGSSRIGAAKSVVAAGRWGTNLRIVYIDADQSLALFLGRSLKSATQVSRLNLTTQYFLAMKNGWVETQVLSGTQLSGDWAAFLQSALRPDSSTLFYNSLMYCYCWQCAVHISFYLISRYGINLVTDFSNEAWVCDDYKQNIWCILQKNWLSSATLKHVVNRCVASLCCDLCCDDDRDFPSIFFRSSACKCFTSVSRLWPSLVSSPINRTSKSGCCTR